ncbi:RNA-directed DNA polymerase [Micromonospora sp. NPDC047793]|uniref:RNA-directed DNA polymerase n=1 Tax=unclassified Micromonospora TaxID=2617518 RepID=UPI0034115190
MPIDRDLLRRLDLHDAVERELSSRNRLLPRRWDFAALASDPSAVERWLRPQVRRGPSGHAANVVLADKGWRGARPLHIMTLEDRVLFRALVKLLSETLPERLRSRVPIGQFKQAPLDVPNVQYISKTDVTAYYEFVDHDLLSAELIAQTGEELAVDALVDLLGSVLGRRIGLPQVHPSSDVLGDTYIDPVRRRLLRRGHVAFSYSDDFRIASPSLGDARASLEACATEARTLGLVLNERKTYTYGSENYRASLTSFAEAEQRLFQDVGDPDDPFATASSLFDPDYDDAVNSAGSLGATPIGSDVDEEDAFTEDGGDPSEEVDARRLQAASRAWEMWVHEDESEEAQAGQDAAITQSLLGRALSTLGTAGDEGPLDYLSELLRFEPALTPQVVAYIEAFARTGRSARTKLRRALDETITSDILSPWQGMWIAQAAGGIRRAESTHGYELWLARCLEGGHDGLAATAAAALGRIGRGNVDLVSAAVERVGPEWRRLAFWGLIRLDPVRAEATAEDELDRLLLGAETAE